MRLYNSSMAAPMGHRVTWLAFHRTGEREREEKRTRKRQLDMHAISLHLNLHHIDVVIIVKVVEVRTYSRSRTGPQEELARKWIYFCISVRGRANKYVFPITGQETMSRLVIRESYLFRQM